MHVAVDLSRIASASFRHEVQRALVELGHEPTAYRGFWPAVASREVGRVPARLVVMADLSRLAAAYEKTGWAAWRECFPRMSPLLVAFVRHRDDERWAHLVDDLVRASACRLWVYTIGNAVKRDLHACLSEFTAYLDPDAVLDVRYSEADRTVWIEFAGGVRRSIPWSALGLPNERRGLRPDTIRVGEDAESLEILDAEGGVFDIDTAAIRALVEPKTPKAFGASRTRTA